MKNSATRHESKNTERPFRLTPRAEKLVAGVASLAMAGLGGGVAMGVRAAFESVGKQGHDYTNEQLDHMQKVSVTVREGEGANSVVLGIDPKSLSPQGLEDLVGYVRDQGNIVKDGVHTLGRDQTVLVPVIKP